MPLFNQRRGSGVLRTSPVRSSRKFSKLAALRRMPLLRRGGLFAHDGLVFHESAQLGTSLFSFPKVSLRERSTAVKLRLFTQVPSRGVLRRSFTKSCIEPRHESSKYPPRSRRPKAPIT